MRWEIKNSMSALPDELLRRIMEIGIQSKTLGCSDLCRLSIACRRLRFLAADDSLWSHLLFSDFPSDFNFNFNDVSSSDVDSKLKRLYKARGRPEKMRWEIKNSMSALPDELWRRIMEIGIQSKTLGCSDLCRLSIACRRLRFLAADDSLWSHLLFSDFPSDFNFNFNDVSSSYVDSKLKRLYKARYESDRHRKRQQQICAVLKLQGKIAEHSGKIRMIELQILEEQDKLDKADAERKYLCQIRHASVALNVWQPEVIRARQEQMVRQCTVPVKSRVKTVEMELSSCKNQIACLRKSLITEKRRLCEAEEKLATVNYHPLQDVEGASFKSGERRITNKKLKLSTTSKF